MNHISTSLPILDGYDKVSGRLCFTEDMKLEGLLHAKLIFSSVAHATIKHIDIEAARAVPGVIGIFHHGNTPGNTYNSTIWFEGQEAPEDETMFPGVLRHIGDRVAAVIAETQEIADKAVRLIEVEYDRLPAVFDAFAARDLCEEMASSDQKSIFEKPVNETTFDYGNTRAAFDRADLIVEDTVTTPKTHHCAMENHVCVAMPEADGRILILTPCQSIFAVQFVVARAIGVPASQLRVVKTPIGGSFGGKAEPVLDPLCAWFAKTLERPVTIAFSRAETFTATRTRCKAIGYIQTAVNRDGRILARDTDVLIDVGAYCTGGIFLPESMAQRLCRIYNIENQHYRGRSFYTNTLPSGAYRGYGSPQIHAISEINLDHVARRLGMDPVKFRLKNLISPNDVDPVTGLGLGNARIRDCVEQGSVHFDWGNRWSAGSTEGRRKRGVGMACATHINGCFPGFHEATTATLRVREDGGLDLTCALHDLGCGSNTVLAQIIAEVLDISPLSIVFSEVDTEICDYDLGTRASRMTYIAGEAVRRTAEKLKLQIFAMASLELNCAATDLFITDGRVFCGDRRDSSISLGELAAREADRDRSLSTTETYRASANPGSYAAHFAEVEVDTLTGAVQVVDYLAVHDLGRAINPQLVEGQIHGGVQMGMGFALFEDIDIDVDNGRVKGDRFSRYHLVNAPEMPLVKVLLVEKHEPTGPYGAKAVGEIATIPPAPAIVNAINHALDTNLTELPVTPERIIGALSPTG
ncbi:MAG: molybdopterin-dependent oxidoreductase [Gammaproteobacteria bacterium]|nr:molybdopterin-dependent oxidoreductase [Gammaproteobacteria bacterium]